VDEDGSALSEVEGGGVGVLFLPVKFNPLTLPRLELAILVFVNNPKLIKFLTREFGSVKRACGGCGTDEGGCCARVLTGTGPG